MKALMIFMIKNPVISNLLFIAVLVGGFMTGTGLRQEVTPDISFGVITVSVVYSGASAEQLSKSVCLPLESAVTEYADKFEDLNCSSRQNIATLVVKVKDGEDTGKIYQDITNSVNSLTTLPEDADDPVIREIATRQQLMQIAFHGPLPILELEKEAENVKLGLEALSGVSYVTTSGGNTKQLEVQVSPYLLAKYGLTLSTLSSKIKASAMDVPGGSIQTDEGTILIRTKAEKTTAYEFEQIPIITTREGNIIYLKDIAKVEMKSNDRRRLRIFDNDPVVFLTVYQNKQDTPTLVEDQVKAFLKREEASYPEPLNFAILNNQAKVFRDRFNLLITNGLQGLVLIFITLTLFLEFRLAFWVMIGVPTSFMGCLFLLNYVDASINMVSLFAFILVSGMVVDDASVVGENIFVLRSRSHTYEEAAIEGSTTLAGAIIFSALTTIVAFAPMLTLPGAAGKFIKFIPLIVIGVLVASLIESLLILPAHLAHSSNKPLWKPLRIFEILNRKSNQIMHYVIHRPLTTVLKWAIYHRYTTIMMAVVSLFATIGLIQGKIVKVSFMPSVEADVIQIEATLPTGYPKDKTIDIIKEIREVGLQVIKEESEKAGEKQSPLLHNLILLGLDRDSSNQKLDLNMFFRPLGERLISTEKVSSIWAHRLKQYPEFVTLRFKASATQEGFGRDLSWSLSNADINKTREASKELQAKLRTYTGVTEIATSEDSGSRETQLSLSKAAMALGIMPAVLGQEIRSAYDGYEVLKIRDNTQEIPVNLRYEQKYRDDITTLSKIPVATPDHGMITLGNAADFKDEKAVGKILRTGHKRVIEVYGSVNKFQANANEIRAEIEAHVIPQLKKKYPGLGVEQAGALKDQAKISQGLLSALLVSIGLIYVLLSIFFSSYIQPFEVMIAIPFGITGAIIGHLVLGYDLSMISFFGIVGLSGVVVNNSLLLLELINIRRREGVSLHLAVIEAVQQRFRPIAITSFTTFIGLMPMITEQSMQARFLIPAAISVGVGVIFSTAVTLFLVPCFHLVAHDLRKLVRYIKIKMY